MKNKKQIKRLEKKVEVLSNIARGLLFNALSETAKRNYPDASALLDEFPKIQKIYCNIFYGIPLPNNFPEFPEVKNMNDAKLYIANLYAVEVRDLELLGLLEPDKVTCEHCHCNEIQW